jgi:hypothetical protein
MGVCLAKRSLRREGLNGSLGFGLMVGRAFWRSSEVELVLGCGWLLMAHIPAPPTLTPGQA